MVPVPLLAEKPRGQVGTMSARAWLLVCLLALFFGGLIGWAARAHTADHRYIKALAERHEAEARFFNRKTDEMIQQNKGNIAKERSSNVTKKN